MEMKKVLIIDDNKSITDMLQVFLSSQFEVVVENDGLKALSTVREFTPNLILLDLMLPGISGHEIASAIGEDTSLKDTPIVFITGELKSKEETEIDGHPFIAKPINFNSLIDTIKSYL